MNHNTFEMQSNVSKLLHVVRLNMIHTSIIRLCCSRMTLNLIKDEWDCDGGPHEVRAGCILSERSGCRSVCVRSQQVSSIHRQSWSNRKCHTTGLKTLLCLLNSPFLIHSSAKPQFLDATVDRQLEAGQRIEKFPQKEK